MNAKKCNFHLNTHKIILVEQLLFTRKKKCTKKKGITSQSVIQFRIYKITYSIVQTTTTTTTIFDYTNCDETAKVFSSTSTESFNPYGHEEMWNTMECYKRVGGKWKMFIRRPLTLSGLDSINLPTRRITANRTDLLWSGWAKEENLTWWIFIAQYIHLQHAPNCTSTSFNGKMIVMRRDETIYPPLHMKEKKFI